MFALQKTKKTKIDMSITVFFKPKLMQGPECGREIDCFTRQLWENSAGINYF